MSYRYDNRSEAQFKKQIKDRTMQELNVFLMWLDYQEEKTGKRPEYEDNGCGQSGELLSDEQVSTDPDFYVKGFGKLEVKFSKPLLSKFFHLKKNQVIQYLKHGASILMVNGAESPTPKFTILKKKHLQSIVDECKVVPWAGFGNKMSYKIPVSDFKWKNLK